MAKAENSMLRAAEAGNVRAMRDIANHYGNRQDFHKAAKWYRASAEQGDAESQSNLGILYANGWGLPKDPYSAYVWISLAKMHGYKSDVTELKRLAREELPPKKLAAAKVAARYLQRAIDGGDVLGFYSSYDPLGLAEAMRRFEAQEKLASRLLQRKELSSE
jgi:TPR repeat protein